jgi:uncharacterized protein (DUF1697 family)
MPTYIALVRAVNVGGTGKLPMSELKKMCEAAGFAKVRTYIASGNVIFQSPKSEGQVKKALTTKVEAYIGKPVVVLARTAAEMAAVASRNPFPKVSGSQVLAIFLDAAPPADCLMQASGNKTEQMRLGTREIYVWYPDGIAASKLRIPAGKNGTARNLNTVAKLAELALDSES